nr:hypothetical protein [Evansella halocellulosilytica]
MNRKINTIVKEMLEWLPLDDVEEDKKEEEEEHLILLKEQLSYLQSILFENRESLKNLLPIDELNGFFDRPPQLSDL